MRCTSSSVPVSRLGSTYRSRKEVARVASSRPNLALFSSDRMNAPALRSGRGRKTSDLHWLAEEGMRVNRARTGNSIRSPARVALMTGTFCSKQGLWDCTNARRRAKGDQPFCCVISNTQPHDPYMPPAPSFDMYSVSEIPGQTDAARRRYRKAARHAETVSWTGHVQADVAPDTEDRRRLPAAQQRHHVANRSRGRGACVISTVSPGKIDRIC